MEKNVEVDPDQAWFWTPEWQGAERAVDEYIASGDYIDFATMEEFLASLDENQ